jgi:hypothetical protein
MGSDLCDIVCMEDYVEDLMKQTKYKRALACDRASRWLEMLGPSFFRCVYCWFGRLGVTLVAIQC